MLTLDLRTPGACFCSSPFARGGKSTKKMQTILAISITRTLATDQVYVCTATKYFNESSSTFDSYVLSRYYRVADVIDRDPNRRPQAIRGPAWSDPVGNLLTSMLRDSERQARGQGATGVSDDARGSLWRHCYSCLEQFKVQTHTCIEIRDHAIRTTSRRAAIS